MESARKHIFIDVRCSSYIYLTVWLLQFVLDRVTFYNTSSMFHSAFIWRLPWNWCQKNTHSLFLRSVHERNFVCFSRANIWKVFILYREKHWVCIRFGRFKLVELNLKFVWINSLILSFTENYHFNIICTCIDSLYKYRIINR